MSFRDRMTGDVGEYQPRWLYLVRKVTDTWGLALAFHVLGGCSWRVAALLACLLYVAIGQVTWWTRHPVDIWGARGRGGVLGDVLYHATVGIGPWLILVANDYGSPLARPLPVLFAIWLWALVWWQLDTARADLALAERYAHSAKLLPPLTRFIDRLQAEQARRAEEGSHA